jgi:hypothetical protein
MRSVIGLEVSGRPRRDTVSTGCHVSQLKHASTLRRAPVQDSLEFGNGIVARTVPIQSPFLKTSIKPPQAALKRLQEMRVVGITNRGGHFDHFSDCHSSLHFSERVRCTG